MIYELIKPLPLTGCMLITESSPEATSLLQELEKLGFSNGTTQYGSHNCIRWFTVDRSHLYKSYHWTHRWTVQVNIPLLGGGVHAVPIDQPTDNDLDFHSHFQLKHQYRGHKLKRFGI